MATKDISDRGRELVDELARTVAGDDERAYVQTVVALMNVAGDMADAPGDKRLDSAMGHLARRAPAKRAAAARRGLRSAAVPPSTPPVEGTIWSDPVSLAKATARARPAPHRGRPTDDRLPRLRRGRARRAGCCSGTLVARNVVLTAAHCERGGCSERVLMGHHTNPAGDGRIVDVAELQVHPDYVEDGASDPRARPERRRGGRPAPSDRRARDRRRRADHAPGRVRQRGHLGDDGYGVKRTVDVPIASPNPTFGADPALELVAGSPFLDRDTCTGDSDGPAYVDSDGGWLIAGATSRVTRSSVSPAATAASTSACTRSRRGSGRSRAAASTTDGRAPRPRRTCSASARSARALWIRRATRRRTGSSRRSSARCR
jgi:hypothetical protein